MIPDYNRAAQKALEILIENNIRETPIMPLPIIKKRPGVMVLSFTEMSSLTDIDRNSLVSMFGENQDAATIRLDNGPVQYVTAYNQRLPLYMLQRALARELGHIVLGHDGSRPYDIRNAEALSFAHHLLCPRPLIRSIQEAGVKLTIEVIGNITGCYERCLAGIRREPGVSVPADLNRAVKDLFTDHVKNFLAFQKYFAKGDESPLADFGPYMENYTEL